MTLMFWYIQKKVDPEIELVSKKKRLWKTFCCKVYVYNNNTVISYMW